MKRIEQLIDFFENQRDNVLNRGTDWDKAVNQSLLLLLKKNVEDLAEPDEERSEE